MDEISRLFGTTRNLLGNLEPYDAIYPAQDAPVIATGEGGARSLGRMIWGFPPPGDVKRPVTNVRNLDSPFWRASLVKPNRRCLVPVTSFCEWTGETGSKRKVWFGVKDLPVFAFAGIWRPPAGTGDGSATADKTEEETSSPLPHYAFLTCAPNETVGAVHPKAMPVILTPDDAELWLTGDWGEARPLVRAFPDERMVVVRD